MKMGEQMLKPCPFCDGQARFIKGRKAKIECEQCSASIQSDDIIFFAGWEEMEAEAVRLWNSRAENAKLRETLAVYADESNWIGCQNPFAPLQKDWLGKGNGFDLAREVLKDE